MKTSPVNIALILGGAIMVCVGAYRACPVSINKKFLWSNGPLAVAMVLIIAGAAFAGGRKFLLAGTDFTVSTTASFLPILIMLMPVIGFSLPLAKHFENEICTALESKFGYLWALGCAFGSPSGNAFAGVVVRLWTTRTALRPLLLYFLSVVPLTSFTIYYVRVLGLGTDVAKEMYRVNWWISIWLMPCFWAYGKFFYR